MLQSQIYAGIILPVNIMEIHNSVNGILETKALPKEAIFKSFRDRLNLENVWILIPAVSIILVGILIYQVIEWCWPLSVLKLRKKISIMMFSSIIRMFLIGDLALALYGI